MAMQIRVAAIPAGRRGCGKRFMAILRDSDMFVSASGLVRGHFSASSGACWLGIAAHIEQLCKIVNYWRARLDRPIGGQMCQRRIMAQVVQNDGPQC